MLRDAWDWRMLRWPLVLGWGAVFVGGAVLMPSPFGWRWWAWLFAEILGALAWGGLLAAVSAVFVMLVYGEDE